VLPTWAEALDRLDQDPDAKPAHVMRFGTQLDLQGVIPEHADRAIGYLAKYLTKAIGETHSDGENRPTSGRCRPNVSPSHTGWVRSRAISFADTNRLWSSTPVNAFAWEPSASRKPPTTSICHNSFGSPAPTVSTPAAAGRPARSGRPVPGSDTPPTYSSASPADPARSRSAGPHDGCARRASNTATSPPAASGEDAPSADVRRHGFHAVPF
jgi:hypothetical protein